MDVKVIRPKCCEKHECDETQCTWGKKLYLQQKDLLKTLDQQWTEHVQSTNKKLEEQRLMQYENQEKSPGDLNNPHYTPGQTLEEKIASNKAFDQTDSLNPNHSISERMNTLNLQNLNSSKNQSFSSSPIPTRKFCSLQWKDKPLTKAEELMTIKLYNETIMHNLNRNKSLCSSASSTSSCSSGSSHAKTINNLNYHSYNQLKSNQSASRLPQVMPTDLDRFESSNNFSSASSYCSVSSLSSVQSSSNKQSENKSSEKVSTDKSDDVNQSKYWNSPFKKRKKVYQLAFDSANGADMIDLGSSESLWRPW